jgi:hypothetical protein
MLMKKTNQKNGQSMLIAVLAFSGAILGATTIAGLLMLYQIRATRDLGNSAKAIFAADAGVEWALFDFYCDATSSSRCMGAQREQEPVGALGNDATVQVTCYDGSGVATSTCSDTANVVSAVARGAYTDARRAFYLNFTGALTMP